MQSPQFQLHAEIEERHWWFVGRRRLMIRLVETLVAPSPDTLIVDIGSGTGANLAALADRYQCLGIDASAHAVALAQQRYPHVKYIQGFAPDDLGDAVRQAKLFLLMDVLEHIPDDFDFLSRMLLAALPGSFFLVTVPADKRLWTKHDESFGHYRRYEKECFERLWQDLPVSPLLVSYFNSRLYPLIRLIRTIGHHRGKASGRAGTDFWMPYPPINQLLENIFAGEQRRLRKILGKSNCRGYARGASLIAVLHRDTSPILPRTRPADVASNQHSPPALPTIHPGS